MILSHYFSPLLQFFSLIRNSVFSHFKVKSRSKIKKYKQNLMENIYEEQRKVKKNKDEKKCKFQFKIKFLTLSGSGQSVV